MYNITVYESKRVWRKLCKVTEVWTGIYSRSFIEIKCMPFIPSVDTTLGKNTEKKRKKEKQKKDEYRNTGI
jgi:hypothetical protein